MIENSFQLLLVFFVNSGWQSFYSDSLIVADVITHTILSIEAAITLFVVMSRVSVVMSRVFYSHLVFAAGKSQSHSSRK
jgi:hypothetical protein